MADLMLYTDTDNNPTEVSDLKPLPVKEIPNSSLIQINLTLTGSAQNLASNACKNATLQAEPTNTGYVYVGIANTVSSTVHMFTLSPGSPVTFYITNTNLLWINGTSGDKICVGGEQRV